MSTNKATNDGNENKTKETDVNLQTEEGEYNVYMPLDMSQNVLWNNEKSRSLIEKLEANKEYKRVAFKYGNPYASHRNYLQSSKQNTPHVNRFDYTLYYSEKDKKLVSLVYLGEKLEGPPGCVHGGAISTIFDSMAGVAVFNVPLDAVTVKLEVNLKKFVVLKSFVLVETLVEKVEGKKVFVKSAMKSLDENTIHADATSLWIKVDFEQMRKQIQLSSTQ